MTDEKPITLGVNKRKVKRLVYADKKILDNGSKGGIITSHEQQSPLVGSSNGTKGSKKV